MSITVLLLGLAGAIAAGALIWLFIGLARGFRPQPPLSGKKYLNLDYEEFSSELIKSQDIARALLT